MRYKTLGFKNEATLTSAVPVRFSNGAVSGATNASPIVVTATSHGLYLPVAITAVTQSTTPTATASPFPRAVVTAAAHGLATGDSVIISGVVGALEVNGHHTVLKIDANTFSVPVPGLMHVYASGGTVRKPLAAIIEGVAGNTAANGTWFIIPVDANSFQLVGSTGNGAYSAPGTWRAVPSLTNGLLMQAVAADVNWRDDGTAPTAAIGGGHVLIAGDEPILYTGDSWRSLQFINAAASSGAKLNITFLKF